MSPLGPATEALFERAFRDAATISAQAAAQLLGLDVKTLRAMTDDQTIRAVRRGKLRSYTEADLRAYLTKGEPPPCRTKTRASSPPRRPKVIPFSQLPT